MALSKETAERLISELRSARQELMVLRAVDATVNAFLMALNKQPPSHGMSPDCVWRAERELAESDEG